MVSNKAIFNFKFPPLKFLILLIIVATIIFSLPQAFSWGAGLGSWAYVGSFVSGMLFASGLLAPFGAGFWSVSVPADFVLAVAFGAAGGTLVDVLIIKSIQAVVRKEIKEVTKNKAVPIMNKLFSVPALGTFVVGIVYALVGFLAPLPLPYKLNKILVRSILRLKVWQMAIMGLVIYAVVSAFFIGFKYALPYILPALGLA